jgi:hypothetical protein
LTNDIDYAAEKWWIAIHTLAVGTSGLRERLLDACRSGPIIVHDPLSTGLGPKMSDELVDRMIAFAERITSTPALADEGTVAATISAMTEEELRRAAEEVLSIA